MDVFRSLWQTVSNRTILTTTFNGFIYRALAAAFICFGIGGHKFLASFIPVFLLVVILCLAETGERWLHVPHSSMVNIVVAIIYISLSVRNVTLETSIDVLVSPERLSMATSYTVALIVASMNGGLVLFSDLWRSKIDLSLMIAFIPSFVEVLAMSLLLLINGIPYSWCILTAVCLTSWDSCFTRRKSYELEKQTLGFRHDIPQLMKSSAAINMIATMFIFNFIAQTIHPCRQNFHQAKGDEGHGEWTLNSSSCTTASFTADTASVGYDIGAYFAASAIACVICIVLYFISKFNGIPKTQSLTLLIMSSSALFYQAPAPRHLTDMSDNILHIIHGGEPLGCFLTACAIMYGWKKYRRPEQRTHGLDNTSFYLKQARNNFKEFLYTVNTVLQVYIAYLIFTYSLADDNSFLKPINDKASDISFELPKVYQLEARKFSTKSILVVVISVFISSILKCLSVICILRWKYREAYLLSAYVGISSMVKGTIPGVLSCYILLVRIAYPSSAVLVKDGEDSFLSVIDGHQLSYSVYIMACYVLSNVIINPLCSLCCSILIRIMRPDSVRRGSAAVELRASIQ